PGGQAVQLRRLALGPRGRRDPHRPRGPDRGRLHRAGARRADHDLGRRPVARDPAQGGRDAAHQAPGPEGRCGAALVSETRLYPGTGRDERTSFAPSSAFEIPADLRELHGRYDVEAMARRVRNFRYAEEWIMMALGGWVATIPEIPVKTGLGKIIWESAQ